MSRIRIPMWVVFLGLALSAWMISAQRAKGAPVPFQVKAPVKVPISNIVGKWHVCWAGDLGIMEFRLDHSYRHDYKGNVYVGTWKGLPTGELQVEENYLDESTTWKWKVRPKMTRNGFIGTIRVLNGSIKWELRCQDPMLERK